MKIAGTDRSVSSVKGVIPHQEALQRCIKGDGFRGEGGTEAEFPMCLSSN